MKVKGKSIRPRDVAREGSVLHKGFVHAALSGAGLTTRHSSIIGRIENGQPLQCPGSKNPAEFAASIVSSFARRKVHLGPFMVTKISANGSVRRYSFDPKKLKAGL